MSKQMNTATSNNLETPFGSKSSTNKAPHTVNTIDYRKRPSHAIVKLAFITEDEEVEELEESTTPHVPLLHFEERRDKMSPSVPQKKAKLVNVPETIVEENED